MIATRVRWIHLVLALGLVVALATSVLFPSSVQGAGDSSAGSPQAAYQEEEEGGEAGDVTDTGPADAAPVVEEEGGQELIAEEDAVLEGGEEDGEATAAPQNSAVTAAQEEAQDGEGDVVAFDRSAIVDDDSDPTTDGYRADQAIVRLTAGADIGTYNERYDTRVIAAIPARNVYLLQLPAASDEPAYVGALSADPDTVWAELNFIGQAPEGRPGASLSTVLPRAPIPAPRTRRR